MTTLSEVKNGTADECGCEFTDEAAVHDLLLSMESLPTLRACLLIGDEEYHWETEADHELFLASVHGFGDPGNFRRFVSQHNWRDPVGMTELAAAVEYASEQAWMRMKQTT